MSFLFAATALAMAIFGYLCGDINKALFAISFGLYAINYAIKEEKK